MLFKTPGFTIIAVMALALGIGANTTIFSVANAVLLRQLPYREPGGLVMVWEHNFKRKTLLGNQNTASPANYLNWCEQNRSFEGIAAFGSVPRNLTGDGEPEEIQSQLTTWNLFSILGMSPVLGRTFTAEEDRPGSGNVVVLSTRLWQRRFNGDPGVVGRSIALNGVSHTIIGVMPRDFHFLDRNTDLWLPIRFTAEQRIPRGRYLRCVGRLKAGVSLAQAQAEMTGISERLSKLYPAFDTGWGINLISLHEQHVKEIRPALLILLGAVGFVLLIVCANVANLLLVRATARQKEMAIRAALGAGRRRIILQLLTESLLLAGMGGALGLLLSLWGTDALRALVTERVRIPRLQEVRIDGMVLGFTAALSVMTGLVFGLVPALGSTRWGLSEALKEGGRQGTSGVLGGRMRNMLVIAQVALTMMLLVGAGLLIRSFSELIKVQPGFNADKLLTLRLTKNGEDQQVLGFFTRVIEAIGTLPGIRTTGAVSFLPFSGPGAATSFRVGGRPEPRQGEKPVTDVRVVTPGFFQAMEIPLIKGRFLSERDTDTSPHVVAVNETLVRQMFPGEDPIGKRLAIDWGSGEDEIVGVVGDIKHMGLDSAVRPMIYFTHPRTPYSSMTLVIRTTGEPRDLALSVQNQIRLLDKNQPIADVRTMEELLLDSVSQRRFSMLLLGLFAAIATLLASIGIYGVVSYSVEQRTQEIGIRMALGARAGNVLQMVLAKGMGLALLGTSIGIAGSFFLTGILSTLLYGIKPNDPLTFGSIAVLMTIVSLIATLVPAHRATRVDPIVALRYE